MPKVTLEQAMQVAFEHHRANRLDEAQSLYREILANLPNFAPALHLLGVLERQRRNPQTALELVQRAIAAEPGVADYHNSLAVFLTDLGRIDEAIAAAHRAVQLRPDYAEGHQTLANALRQKGDAAGSMAGYEAALRVNPNLPEACNNLGIVYLRSGRVEDAVRLLNHAITLVPNWPQAWNNYANALFQDWKLNEALAACRHALNLRPNFDRALSNLAFFSSLDPTADEKAIVEIHRQWDKLHGEPLRNQIRPHSNNRSPDRRLRIGYISPDLREHSVAYFVEPLLASHDSAQVEVFCYSGAPQQDQTSVRLRSYGHHWQDVSKLSGEHVTDLIRRNQIDILVDLSGHTAGGRLPILARKPAPVQVSYLGYPNTTGLSAIDYRLTDVHCDPAGMTELYYSEQLARLSETLACYRPADAAPDVTELPAIKNEHITFGSFCVLPKLNDELIKTWSRILQQVEGSRLLVAAAGLNEPGIAQRVRDAFAKHGADPARLQLVGQMSLLDYLASHAHIDLILDSFPVNGHTITCHGLWMGVPSICLTGKTYRGRLATSVMTNLGLPQFIAANTDQYVAIAAKLSSDTANLAQLRSTMRDRMRSSVLMDAPRFARNVESAYRDMWRRWCSQA